LNYDCLVNLCWYLPIPAIYNLSRADSTLTARIWAKRKDTMVIHRLLYRNDDISYSGTGNMTCLFNKNLFTGIIKPFIYPQPLCNQLPRMNYGVINDVWVITQGILGDYNTKYIYIIDNMCQPIFIDVLISADSYLILNLGASTHFANITRHVLNTAHPVGRRTHVFREYEFYISKCNSKLFTDLVISLNKK